MKYKAAGTWAGTLRRRDVLSLPREGQGGSETTVVLPFLSCDAVDAGDGRIKACDIFTAWASSQQALKSPSVQTVFIVLSSSPRQARAVGGRSCLHVWNQNSRAPAGAELCFEGHKWGDNSRTLQLVLQHKLCQHSSPHFDEVHEQRPGY